jgi:hypothetical protein
VQRDGVVTRRFVITGVADADGILAILSGVKEGEKDAAGSAALVLNAHQRPLPGHHQVV